MSNNTPYVQDIKVLKVDLRTTPTERFPEGVFIKPGKKLPPGSLQKPSGEVSTLWHKYGPAEMREKAPGEADVIIIGQAYRIGYWKLYDLESGYGLAAILRKDGTIIPRLRVATQRERYALMKKKCEPAVGRIPQNTYRFMEGTKLDRWPVVVKLWEEESLEEEEIQAEEMLAKVEESGADVTDLHLSAKDLEEEQAAFEFEELAPEELVDDDDDYQELNFDY